MDNQFQRYFETINYQIDAGGEFTWECWKGARYFDARNKNGVASMIADPVIKRVYQITTFTEDSTTPYRWTNPDYALEEKSESDIRRVNKDLAWGDTRWADTDSFDDILTKVYSILNGIPFDTRVVVTVDMDNYLFNMLARAAHEKDITLNEYFCRALQETLSIEN